jgi:outer membrane biosynthesis protein TonB
MRVLSLGLVLATAVLGPTTVRAQATSPLENAKALYDSASFDEALAALDRLKSAQPEKDVEEVQRYRALCLLALNRTTEAQNAIEIVFSRDPLYKIAEGDAPPRMRSAFMDVRRRLLPRVTEQLYAAAKLSFDRKDYSLAATQFSDLLTFLDDADAKELPSLNEFRMLAKGFHDLSAATSAPPPPVPTPAPAPAAQTVPPSPSELPQNAPVPVAQTAVVDPPPSSPPPPSDAPAPADAPPPAALPDAAGVLQPPVIIRQQFPLWLGMRDFAPRGSRGMIRVIIDELGNVEDARIVQTVHTVYDPLLLSAARTWKYEPARQDGKPVRYVKVIEVVLNPQ